MEQVPQAYTEGYAKARLYDEAAADNYIRHTTIGDPELDPMMEELASSMEPGELHRFIGAGIEQRDEVLREAPQALRDFFNNLEDPPWLPRGPRRHRGAHRSRMGRAPFQPGRFPHQL